MLALLSHNISGATVRFQLFLLASYVLSCQDLRAQLAGLWRDENQPSSRVLASYDESFGTLRVRRNGGSYNVLPLGLTGVRGLGRIDAGVDTDVFLLWGASPSPNSTNSGYVILVREAVGVFSTPVTAWAAAGTPTGAGYSSLLGELVFFDDDTDFLYSASFSPASMSLGTFVTSLINKSALPAAERALMSAYDDDGQAVAVLSSEYSIGPRIKLRLHGGGVTSPLPIEPLGGSDHGICRDVVIQSGIVHAYGQPGALLEAFSVDSNQTLGVAMVGVNGLAEIAVSGLATGDRVSVRDFLVGGAGTTIRNAYSVVGSSTSGPSGLTPLPFGGNSAATMVAGNTSFGVLCRAEAPVSAPAQWPGIAVFGLPSNVVFAPPLGWAMIGAEVIIFPAGLVRTRESVLGMASVPIPMSTLGLELCLQWMALDRSTIVSSQIACMRVVAGN